MQAVHSEVNEIHDFVWYNYTYDLKNPHKMISHSEVNECMCILTIASTKCPLFVLVVAREV